MGYRNERWRHGRNDRFSIGLGLDLKPGRYELDAGPYHIPSSSVTIRGGVELTVKLTDPPLVLRPIPDKTVEAGKALTLTAAVENPVCWRGRLQYSVSSSPLLNARIDGELGQLTCTPPVYQAAGPCPVAVRVSSRDGRKSDQKTFWITIRASLELPVPAAEKESPPPVAEKPPAMPSPGDDGQPPLRLQRIAPQTEPSTGPQPVSETAGPSPQDLRQRALDDEFAKATKEADTRQRAWDFQGEVKELQALRFDKPELAKRLERRRGEAARMADLKQRMIDQIKHDYPSLQKADLLLPGRNGTVMADAAEIAVPSLGESFRWSELSPAAVEKLLGLEGVVDGKNAEDCLAAGLLLVGRDANANKAAEEYFNKAKSLGADTVPYMALLPTSTPRETKGEPDKDPFLEAGTLAPKQTPHDTNPAGPANSPAAPEVKPLPPHTVWSVKTFSRAQLRWEKREARLISYEGNEVVLEYTEWPRMGERETFRSSTLGTDDQEWLRAYRSSQNEKD